jgi:Pyridine nucleotide-disulphide oxidoreductase, dimerisation domain
MHEVDRAITDGEDEGFVKIHVKECTDEILGATVVARHAGEMINDLSIAMSVHCDELAHRPARSRPHCLCLPNASGGNQNGGRHLLQHVPDACCQASNHALAGPVKVNSPREALVASPTNMCLWAVKSITFKANPNGTVLAQ